MKKYRVVGTTVVTVCKEVWASSEEEAINKADNQLSCLTAYCGNGGHDKLVGVDGYDESVDADGYIEWDDAEVLENDPDYFECFDCEVECERRTDINGNECWYCSECERTFDDDGEDIWVEFEEED